MAALANFVNLKTAYKFTCTHTEFPYFFAHGKNGTIMEKSICNECGPVIN